MARGKTRAASRVNRHYLPEEILILILVRLPVKSLLRFRLVCKSWYSLTRNPTFIEAYLNHQTNKTNLFLFKYESICCTNYCYSIRYDDETLCEYFEPNLPRHLKSLWVDGSCNGLVCLSDKSIASSSSSIFLWNPALRKLKTFPKPQIIIDLPLNYCDYHISIAFGFHSQVNDYKVVRIVFFKRGMDNPYKTSFLGEVYSLSTDSWRRIDALAPSFSITACSPAFLNGAVYWTDGRKAARFLMGSEVFEEVMLPDIRPHSYQQIFVLEELLYLVSFDYNYSAHNYCCHIWTMESSKMGSWTKRFTFHDLNLDDANGKLLGLRRNGELLTINHSNKLISYNLEIQKLKDLGINTLLWNNACAHSYVESLILVDGGGDSFSTW